MKCPCEECISYPICISKTSIQCDDFHMYTSHVGASYTSENKPPYDIDSYWEHVNSILPKVTRILGDRREY